MFKKILLTAVFSLLIFFILPDVSFGQTYRLDVQIQGGAPEVFGSVVGSGNNINCVRSGTNTSGTCFQEFPAGSRVTLVMEPIIGGADSRSTRPGFFPHSWSMVEDCVLPTPDSPDIGQPPARVRGDIQPRVCSFTIDSDTTIQANFRHCDFGFDSRCLILEYEVNPLVVGVGQAFTLSAVVRDAVGHCTLSWGSAGWRTCEQAASFTPSLTNIDSSWKRMNWVVDAGIVQNTEICLACFYPGGFLSDTRWDNVTVWALTDPINGNDEENGNGEPTCENCDLTVTVVAHNSQGTVVGSDAFSGLTPSPCTVTNGDIRCSVTTPGGAVGTLTPEAGPGSEFGYWRGACALPSGERNYEPVCTLTMNSNLSALAYFFREGEVPPPDSGNGTGNGGGLTPGGPGTSWPSPIPPGPGDPFPNPMSMQCDDIFSCLLEIARFLFWISLPIFIIAIIVGGFYIMFSAGDEKRYARGKQIIAYAVVGLAIAWVALGLPLVIVDIFSG